jgi:hypothetical protein
MQLNQYLGDTTVFGFVEDMMKSAVWMLIFFMTCCTMEKKAYVCINSMKLTVFFLLYNFFIGAWYQKKKAHVNPFRIKIKQTDE